MDDNLICQYCKTGELTHKKVNDTNFYLCNMCPNISIEFYTFNDLENLEKYLKGETSNKK